MSRKKIEHLVARECARRLRALCDPANEQCAVAPEHKEAVALYVRTWILPDVVWWAARATHAAELRRTRGRYAVGEQVDFCLDRSGDPDATWVLAVVTAVEPAHGVARSVTIRTLQGCTTHTVKAGSKRLAKYKT